MQNDYSHQSICLIFLPHFVKYNKFQFIFEKSVPFALKNGSTVYTNIGKGADFYEIKNICHNIILPYAYKRRRCQCVCG